MLRRECRRRIACAVLLDTRERYPPCVRILTLLIDHLLLPCDRRPWHRPAGAAAGAAAPRTTRALRERRLGDWSSCGGALPLSRGHHHAFEVRHRSEERALALVAGWQQRCGREGLRRRLNAEVLLRLWRRWVLRRSTCHRQGLARYLYDCRRWRRWWWLAMCGRRRWG